MTRLALVSMAPDDPRVDVVVPHAFTSAKEQLDELARDLKRPASAFLDLPFAALAEVVGGIPEGELWYAGAFSGDGKTAFFTSLVLACLEQGKRVYYVPTESPGKVIKAHLACKTLGFDVGDFLSGEYLKWPNAKEARAAVWEESKKYHPTSVENTGPFWIAESGFLTETRLEAEAAYAAELKADLFIVDHIDHVEGIGNGLYEASVSANKTILHCAHTYGLRCFAATQFNLEAVKGNRVVRYLAPRESYVYMGNHKRMIADGMLGLYRPLKLSGLDLKLVQAFKEGDASVKLSDILEPNTMAVHIMKHRKYGAREGKKIYLNVHHGRVQDFTLTETGSIHGIRTTKGGLFD